MKLIRFNQLIDTPWKNGRGVTRQIYIHPEQASFDDFLFRISAASINEPCAFSEYPGIQRSLAVLSGQGLVLTIKDTEVSFIPNETIIGFEGSDPVNVVACPEPVLDFGVMSQRSAGYHTLTKHEFEQQAVYKREATFTFVFSLNRMPVTLVSEQEEKEYLLNQNDGLLLTQKDSTCFFMTHEQPSSEIISCFIAEFFLV